MNERQAEVLRFGRECERLARAGRLRFRGKGPEPRTSPRPLTVGRLRTMIYYLELPTTDLDLDGKRHTASHVLGRCGDGWEVLYVEHGSVSDRATFAREDEACAYLLGVICQLAGDRLTTV